MLQISQINSKLVPFKNHSVLLWGIGNTCKQMIDLFHRNEIYPQAICNPTSNSETIFHSLHIIHPQNIISLDKIENIVIQLSLDTYEEEQETRKLLEQIGYHAVLTVSETWSMLHFMSELEENYKNPQEINYNHLHNTHLLQEQLKLQTYSDTHLDQELILLCMPPKTGDHTIMNTFHNNTIPFHFVFHRPKAINIPQLLDTHSKVKIITALRDPIGENISLLYQIMEDLNQSLTARYLLTNKYGRNFFSEGGDVQEFFNLFLNGIHDPNLCGSHPIQRFIPVFQEHILDFTEFPFDQEKGYAICKHGNLEIFIYQLEKLNYLTAELSTFLEKNVKNLTLGNISADKWIHKSYEKAKKQLKFSKTYFDSAYNAPWLHHTYSEKTINEFKSKWVNQII